MDIWKSWNISRAWTINMHRARTSSMTRAENTRDWTMNMVRDWIMDMPRTEACPELVLWICKYVHDCRNFRSFDNDHLQNRDISTVCAIDMPRTETCSELKQWTFVELKHILKWTASKTWTMTTSTAETSPGLRQWACPEMWHFRNWRMGMSRTRTMDMSWVEKRL